MESTPQSVKLINCHARERLPDFLLAEYNHMVESFLRNEESGEKRATFFVTLVGAAGGILGFVFGDKSSFLPLEWIPVAVAAVAAILLCFGILTVRRLVTRNIVTDEYKFALRALRRLFLTPVDAASVPNAFFNPYAPATDRSLNVWRIGKGGWLETVAFVNTLLMGTVAVCLMVWSQVGWQRQVIVCLAACVTTWIGQLSYAYREIGDHHAELKAAEPDYSKAPELPKCGSTV